MNRSTPGLPVHHQLPDFTQTQVHRAISSSVVPFSSCPQSLPASKSFSNESTLRMRWPKYWSFSFSIIPSKEIPGLISFRMDWFTQTAWLLDANIAKTPNFRIYPLKLFASPKALFLHQQNGYKSSGFQISVTLIVLFLKKKKGLRSNIKSTFTS